MCCDGEIYCSNPYYHQAGLHPLGLRPCDSIPDQYDWKCCEGGETYIGEMGEMKCCVNGTVIPDNWSWYTCMPNGCSIGNEQCGSYYCPPAEGECLDDDPCCGYCPGACG